MLDRAFEPDAAFSADEIALVAPFANAIDLPRPAEERTIRQSLGSLAAALPSQSSDVEAGKLKLATYVSMLAGCDERALAYACRRCLDELDWMPTVHQLKERMAKWIGPEAAAIVRAKAIMRRAPAAVPDVEAPIAPDQVERVNAFLARSGIHTRFSEDGTTFIPSDVASDDRSAYVPHEEAA